jgi:hypothetical protein
VAPSLKTNCIIGQLLKEVNLVSYHLSVVLCCHGYLLHCHGLSHGYCCHGYLTGLHQFSVPWLLVLHPHFQLKIEQMPGLKQGPEFNSFSYIIRPTLNAVMGGLHLLQLTVNNTVDLLL